MDPRGPAPHETKIDSEEVFAGRMIQVFNDRVLLPSGKEGTREVVRHGGAVGVIPLFDDGRVLLVEQYRYPLDKRLLEIPAGKLDVAGEEAEACARRELLEETGYEAARWQRLMRYASSPGFADERIVLFRAEQLSFKGYDIDPDEGTVCRILPLAEALAMVQDGRIEDAKTIIALLWCKAFSAA